MAVRKRHHPLHQFVVPLWAEAAQQLTPVFPEVENVGLAMKFWNSVIKEKVKLVMELHCPSSCSHLVQVGALEDGKQDAQKLEAKHKLHRLGISTGFDIHINKKTQQHHSCKHLACKGLYVRAWSLIHAILEKVFPNW